MASLKERLSQRVTWLRERRPVVDHLVRMQEHYGAVKAGQQAGAVTYFGFLSFFPILALSFAVVGWVAKVYPDARDTTVEAVQSVFPGMIGNRDGQIALSDIESAAGAAVGFGLLGVAYAGLGWLSSLRDALLVTFEMPSFEQPNFVVGKLRDLLTLGAVGVTLILSVAISGIVAGGSEQILEWLGLGVALKPLLWVLGVLVGLLASTVLFLALFRLLADPHTPKRSLASGALLGAIGFEILKLLSSTLLKATQGQPAFQAFGIALILVVWINYFSRVVLYAAAWAHTSPEARAARVEEPAVVQGPQVPSLTDLPATAVPGERAPGAGAWKGPFAAGAGTMLALTAVLRKSPGKKERR
ncbi:YihY/virulence factor BrkB family protein [Nocardioides lijunqiniae]|uniref:YihY/virulence factor BrkB family protein n=1 Tax=Nocardioides lijunqiniae TaxID=2760832 RepID=UPI0018779B8F|nr:YhjD/YihY/BrkB family envelope integrity protein [Nocardioides lijunqiniae]